MAMLRQHILLLIQVDIDVSVELMSVEQFPPQLDSISMGMAFHEQTGGSALKTQCSIQCTKQPLDIDDELHGADHFKGWVDAFLSAMFEHSLGVLAKAKPGADGARQQEVTHELLLLGVSFNLLHKLLKMMACLAIPSHFLWEGVPLEEQRFGGSLSFGVLPITGGLISIAVPFIQRSGE